jgi:DNA (cytosine-5)-methyltransferase 1
MRRHLPARDTCAALEGEDLNELALFAGAGGGILGGHLLGWRTVCAVERDAYAAQILAQRQNDGILRPFPIWSDVTTFDGRPWRGRVDVVSGGFPCTDISAAGKGAGIDGESSGLWRQMARIVREVQPQYVFVENSPALTSRGLGRILGDLADMGFDAEWGVLGAHNAGAPHLRDRIWIVAHAVRFGSIESEGFTAAAYNQERDDQAYRQVGGNEPNQVDPGRQAFRGTWRYGWPAEPGMGRMVSAGVANSVDQLKTIGNGQVSRVAGGAFLELAKRFT